MEDKRSKNVLENISLLILRQKVSFRGHSIQPFRFCFLYYSDLEIIELEK